MKSGELVKKHSEICKMLNEVYEKKNKDYGNSFEETYKRLGIISAVTRISDKMSRLESLATKTEEERLVKDESIRDTVLDMANYCIMLSMELDREKFERESTILNALPQFPRVDENLRDSGLVMGRVINTSKDTINTISAVGIPPYTASYE